MSQESTSLSEESSTSSSYNESLLAHTSIYSKTLKIDFNSTISELDNAIEKSKNLLLSKEVCSDERLWLVRHIVELRLRVQEMKDSDNIPKKISISTMGHRFNIQVSSKTHQQFCDNCSSVIWNIVQGSYICEDCGFVCHFKCINNIRRVCAHVLLSERNELEMLICPEKGIDIQQYKCAECQTQLLTILRGDISCIGRSFLPGSEKLVFQPRMCDYSGLYYCTNCHWNDKLPIPARVIHNWDWDEKPVSRVAFQLLKISFNQPNINIEKHNISILKFVSELSWIHKMRKNLLVMQQYLNTCPLAPKNETKLIRNILLHTVAPNHYSMSQLKSVKDGTLENELSKHLEAARVHITQCEQCSGKGYLCEMCGNNQIIFPFDSGAICCTLCNSLFHRSCWIRKGQSCPKCKRIAKRKINSESPVDDLLNEHEVDQWIENTEEQI